MFKQTFEGKSEEEVQLQVEKGKKVLLTNEINYLISIMYSFQKVSALRNSFIEEVSRDLYSLLVERCMMKKIEQSQEPILSPIPFVRLIKSVCYNRI